MNEKNGIVLEIVPSTIDEGNSEHIIDAYVKFDVNGFIFWAFVHEWTKYFPYWKNQKWNASNYLYLLIGKKFKISLNFLNLGCEKSDSTEKKLLNVVNQKKPCDYYLVGKIIDKSPNPEYADSEIIYVDCGLRVKTTLKKPNDFKIGDYIKIDGRLDAYFDENPNDKFGKRK